MNDEKRYVEKQFYRVVINAPIETVWSELVNTKSAAPGRTGLDESWSGGGRPLPHGVQ